LLYAKGYFRQALNPDGWLYQPLARTTERAARAVSRTHVGVLQVYLLWIILGAAAVLALVLLDIGYMRGRWGFVLDTPWVYLALGVVAGLALGYRAWELWSVGFLPFPQNSPGVAAAAVGVALVLYGAGRGLSAGAGSRR
jgi:hypothetical protein